MVVWRRTAITPEADQHDNRHHHHHHRCHLPPSFECNYGVPFPIDFDKMFGTWVDYKEFKDLGGKLPKKLRDSIARRSGRVVKEEEQEDQQPVKGKQDQ
jgi:sterol desaturase/sphingolipid hydroxylase (fatty acid hydroxylase superfamily)